MQDDSEFLLDLDRLELWLVDCGDFDPVLVMDAWNFFADLARSLGQSVDSQAEYENDIYEKLFFSLNLPAVNRGGLKYEPDWSEAQLDCIAEVMRTGLSLLMRALQR